VLETLDAAAVGRWCAGGLAALKQHQSEIDNLNVYPVPDGDTGTNLVLTFTSAQQALALNPDNPAEREHAPHARALRLMARGALRGARGNSGVIVSQILGGLAEALSGVAVARGRALAGALRAATDAAYAAVAKPVEGTVLTVVAAAARAADRADTDDLGTVVRAAAAAAADALARTPEQLPALARAGVVDAGGRGLCVLLDALAEVITGDRPDRPAPAARAPAATVRETGSPPYAYEVQFLLDAEPSAVDRLRAVLAGLGDSLVVVCAGTGQGAAPTWNVHVHVNDVGAAVEAGVVAGRPHQISVTRFDDRATRPALTSCNDAELGPDAAEPARATPRTTHPFTVDRRGTAAGAATAAPEAAGGVPANPSPTGGSPAPDVPGRAAVVVAAGDGLADLFTAEGATLVAGNPSTGELLAAIRSTRAARVVVLPNDANAQAVAGVAAKEAQPFGLKVSVVPTRSPVQALAALAVRDPARPFEDDVIAMAEAAGACRYAEVCHASREALTVAGRCQPGDVLALVEGEVHLIGSDLVHTCQALLDGMLGGGGELVTLLIGADAPAGLADAVRAHVSRRWPFVELHVYQGGQPHYPLLVGIE
jgi:DAK2 domain fusion protein YloV